MGGEGEGGRGGRGEPMGAKSCLPRIGVDKPGQKIHHWLISCICKEVSLRKNGNGNGNENGNRDSNSNRHNSNNNNINKITTMIIITVRLNNNLLKQMTLFLSIGQRGPRIHHTCKYKRQATLYFLFFFFWKGEKRDKAGRKKG